MSWQDERDVRNRREAAATRAENWRANERMRADTQARQAREAAAQKAHHRAMMDALKPLPSPPDFNRQSYPTQSYPSDPVVSGQSATRGSSHIQPKTSVKGLRLILPAVSECGPDRNGTVQTD
jgi:hypothetical protein